jgi:hypothetical protein
MNTANILNIVTTGKQIYMDNRDRRLAGLGGVLTDLLVSGDLVEDTSEIWDAIPDHLVEAAEMDAAERFWPGCTNYYIRARDKALLVHNVVANTLEITTVQAHAIDLGEKAVVFRAEQEQD